LKSENWKDFNLARERFLLSAKHEIAVPESAKSCFAELKSFKFAVFAEIFDTQGFFPAKCKTAKSKFPESAKSSLPN
jgi:hypothetical protein